MFHHHAWAVGSSPAWELSKSKSTQPRSARRCPTLYTNFSSKPILIFSANYGLFLTPPFLFGRQIRRPLGRGQRVFTHREWLLLSLGEEYLQRRQRHPKSRGRAYNHNLKIEQMLTELGEKVVPRLREFFAWSCLAVAKQNRSTF